MEQTHGKKKVKVCLDIDRPSHGRTYPRGPTILGNTTRSPVIESIGSCCLLREPKMLQSRRLFLESLGAAALAVQVRSFPALSSMVDRLAWQRDAKFGMFVHWGPYSVAGVEASWPVMLGPELQRRFVEALHRMGLGEVEMPLRPITLPEYEALPERFVPDRFDADEWVDLAAAAGQRYLVLTTK